VPVAEGDGHGVRSTGSEGIQLWRIHSRRTCPARLSRSAAAFAALLIHRLPDWCGCSGGLFGTYPVP